MNQLLTSELNSVMPQAVATGLFVSLCTAQSLDTVQGPTGNPVGTYTNVPNLVNIPCMNAVPSIARIQANEVQGLADIMSKGYRHVLLDGWYPQFIPGVSVGWRVIVDGLVYNLLGAEDDSQEEQTRLELQLANLTGGA